ncbi:putative 44.6 kDa protein in cps region [Geobacter sp. OR-1]|uniref:TIGR03087 family PEP-CTERM/XrtA system glycosyltransferase n=1 Tax=Geobacter sp. OR-1 TaxID=1266765 RepID=UPI000541A128|nr:TIGR03087 family PEP-CTERM/XrtA system glycosyltransferase [Geobacter sp. OR-1]GAM11821.1 putative 44.6 kDa protein in cps region [Geobacter sp. OR-1]
MRILYLSQRVPYPPNKGDKLRSFNQIKFLSNSHEILLVCLSDNSADLQHVPSLKPFCSSVDIVQLPPIISRLNALKALFTEKPLTLAYFFSDELKKVVKNKIENEKIDLIFVYCSSMAQYVEDVADLPKVIDFVDVDSEKWAQYAMHAKFPLRQIYRIEDRRLRRYETSLCNKFQRCFLVSEKEVDDFHHLVTPSERVVPLLNGVDLGMFQPDEQPYDSCRLVFTGVMDYFANVETVLYFYQEIYPHVRKAVPGVKFYVVGSNPVKELFEIVKSDKDVVVTGYVDDIRPYVQQSAVFVAPMRIARGVQNKILEAMAMGVPVVTNSLGFNGVSANAGSEILVEDDPFNFAQQVVKLITDHNFRQDISRKARKAVEERYNWNTNLSGLNETLSEVKGEFTRGIRVTSQESNIYENGDSRRTVLKNGKLKILYICHRFPFPPKRGGKIRPFNMIRHFTLQGHEVTVCSLSRSVVEAKEGAGIAAHCKRYEMVPVNKLVQVLRMAGRLPLATPSSMGYFYSHNLKRRIDKLLARESFDLIFVHCSSVAQYVEDVKGIPKILDFGDMDSQKWLEYAQHKPFPFSLGYWLEGTKLEAAEKTLARKFDICTATTRAEWETLTSYNSALDTNWFPNGVDANYFKPDGGPYDPNTISFIGRMDYYPNQECMFDFCKNTLPIIRVSCPDAKLLIVGADPSPAVVKLGELPGVTVTGSVPDVRPYVLRSAVMVAPLNIARGTQNKILEAMAMGVPVVTSPMGAGGVDAEDGIHFLVGSGPEEYAQACLRLMLNPDERARFSVAGRERMLSHHDWQASMKRLDGIVEHLLSTYQPDVNE